MKAMYLRLRCRFIEVILADMEGKSQPAPLGPGYDLNGLKKFDAMWKSLTAVKGCFDALLSVKPPDWIGFPLAASVQISHCFGILFSLSTCEDPAWDCQLVRSTCDLAVVLSTIAEIATQASVEAGETADEDLFSALSGNMRRFREGFLLKLSQLEQQQNPPGVQVPSVDAGLLSSTPFPYTWPAHGFFGTGEWMETIFDGGFPTD